MTSLLLPLILLGGPRLAFAQDPSAQAEGCLPSVEDPASRGLFIADPDGLIPEHIKASLHLSTLEFARREGLTPRILTARSSPKTPRPASVSSRRAGRRRQRG
ncbi:MAG: hypothetical protein IPI35_00225 [Deltaproteobacteria bacterium]|nr:hypothetical protein [Deltaproteobacteria bacterium]